MTLGWADPRRWPAWLVPVLVASIALRLLAWWIAGDRVPIGDPANYTEIARNIIAGRGIVIYEPHLLQDARGIYPPLMPILLAGIGLVAPLNATTFAVLNTVIDLACAGLIARCAAEANERKAGLLAAAVYILWPVNCILAPVARKEGLIELLVVAQVLILLRIVRAPGWAAVIGYGIVTGLIALTQPALATLAALFGLVALFHMRDRGRWFVSMAAAALCTILVLVPWWIRNWLVFHKFVPLGVGGGGSLWMGSTPLGDGTWIKPPAHLLVGNEITANERAGDEAKAYISAHPWAYLKHCVAKLGRAFASDVNVGEQLLWMEPRQHLAVTRLLALVATFAHLGLLIVGTVAAFIRRRSILTHFLLACFAQILIFGIWFEFAQRHRYFLTPLLILVAAVGVVDWNAKRRPQKTETLPLPQ